MTTSHRFDLIVLPGLLLSLFFLSAWLIPLAGDEAYYWLWSTRPQWGYCDHPPAVAWLGHILQFTGSSNVALFRLPGWLAYLGSVFFMARLAGQSEEDPKRASNAYRWTVAIAVVSPLLAHYATEMGPDSPLLLAWSLGCWSAYQALYNTSARSWGWPLFGGATALAVNSKLTGWLLPLCLLGYMITSNRRRPELANPRFWSGVLVGGLLLLPHVLWNYWHDGQNYFFQWHLRRQHMAWQWGNLFKPLELLADQGLLSLFTLAALVWTLRMWRAGQTVGRPVIPLLLWFALPLQTFFLVFRILGVGRWNWPLPSYLPLSALLAIWLVDGERFRGVAFRLALWFTAAWTLGSVSLRTFPQMQLWVAQVMEPAHQLTLRTNDLALAYPEVGARMRVAQEQRLFLLNEDYTEAAALTYYSGYFVRVVGEGRYQEGSQFYLWNKFDELIGRDALLVCHRRLEDMPHVLISLQSSFESYKRLPEWQISTPASADPITFYPVYCKRLIRPLLQR